MHAKMGSDSGKVVLLGMWASPAVRRVEWALKMKGIEYNYIEEDLTNKSSSLLKYNPIHKQVPVLVHNGRPIIESLVILEYIDETWKEKPILPKDPYERAVARFWATFTEDKSREATREVFLAEGEEKAKALVHLQENLRILDEQLKGKKFFGGETIGYLDLVVGWMAFWLGMAEEVASFKAVDPKMFPSFSSWINNFRNDPLITDNLPPWDKTVEFFHEFRRAGLGSSA